MKPALRKIFLSPDAAAAPMARRLLEQLPEVPVERLGDEAPPQLPADDFYQAWREGKRWLWLRRNRQCRPRPCPATPEHLCCGLRTFDLLENCPYDCHYCALQNYLNTPLLCASVNVGDFVDEIARAAAAAAPAPYRVTMGELSDCLALDELLQINLPFIELARRQTNLVIEFKTKGGAIDHLLAAGSGVRNAVFSFSLNPQFLIEELEPGAHPLEERLAFARSLGGVGFGLAFHLDPIIPGISIDIYKEMLECLFERLSPLPIYWISLGSLRFTKGMLEILRFRFPQSRLLQAPLFPGKDGKWRLSEEERIASFAPLLETIGRRSPATFAYLCMESERVWQGACGWHPADGTAFKGHFDRAVAGHLAVS